MTDALAKALADIDDPETIQRIIAGLESGDSKQPASQPTQATLYELYERYLDRRTDRSPATRAQYKRTLPAFIDFLEGYEVTYPAEITTELVDSYIDYLTEKYDKDATIFTYTKNARAWLKWLHKRNLVSKTLYSLLDKDEVGVTPAARDEAISQEEAAYILSKLRQQRRGSAIHALLELLWNTGLRIGEVRALDLSDFNPEENDLQIRHRPESGTRIKNGNNSDSISEDGERNTELHPQVVEALQLYIDYNRHDVTDEFRREPLVTTSQGRASRSTLRRWVYEATSCRWAESQGEELHCDGTCDPDSSVCPYSYYPHAIRRGAIVDHLSGGLRLDLASQRFDVSPRTLQTHYDPRSKERRKEDRAEAVRSAWSDL